MVALAVNRDYSPNKPFHRLEGGMAKNHYSALQVDVVALAINRNYSHRMEGDGKRSLSCSPEIPNMYHLLVIMVVHLVP